MINIVKTLTSLFSLFIIGSIAAQAQLVSYNLIFPMTGPAVLGKAGDEWNTLNNTTGTSVVGTNLVDSSGDTDAFGNGAVGLSFTNLFISVDSSSGDGPLDGPSANDPLAPNLFTIYSIGVGFANGNNPTGAPANLTYSGLADNSLYTLDLYSRNQPGSSGREFTVTAPGLAGSYSETLIDEESATFSSKLDTSASDILTYGTPVYKGNYIQLIVKSNASGDVTLDLDSGSLVNGFTNGGEFDVSGAQLQAGVVPEPGTVSMIAVGVGILSLLIYRRREKLS